MKIFELFEFVNEYREGPDSTFTHFGKEYSVDDLLDLAKGRPIEILPISSLTWIFDYSMPDDDRVNKVDVSYPIIVTRNLVDGVEKYIVLNGFHRLFKAYLSQEVIQAYFIPNVEVEALPQVS